jgi:hypothetical protein
MFETFDWFQKFQKDGFFFEKKEGEGGGKRFAIIH